MPSGRAVGAWFDGRRNPRARTNRLEVINNVPRLFPRPNLRRASFAWSQRLSGNRAIHKAGAAGILPEGPGPR
jgi:hypothetical protein